MISLSDTAPSLTLLILDFGTAPYESSRALAWGAALILLLIVLGLNIVVRVASRLKVTGSE